MPNSPETKGKFAQAEARHAAEEGHEQIENRAERERVLAVLHLWHEMENKNLPLQRELAQASEELGKALPEVIFVVDILLKADGIKGDDMRVSNGWVPSGTVEPVHAIYWKEKNGSERGFDGRRFGENGILDRDDVQKKFKNNPKFLEASSRVKKAVERVLKLRNELVAQRERILQETLTALGYGSLLALPKKFMNDPENTLYSIGGSPWIKFDQELGRDIAGYRVGDGLGNFTMKNIFEEAKEKLGITDEEIKQVKEIDWSPEEQEKIQRLKMAVGGYQAELKQVTPKEVAEKGFFYRYTDHEYGLMISLMVTAWARAAYDKLGLPAVHRERILSELKISGDINI